jgi:hypothetical protein
VPPSGVCKKFSFVHLFFLFHLASMARPRFLTGLALAQLLVACLGGIVTGESCLEKG